MAHYRTSVLLLLILLLTLSLPACLTSSAPDSDIGAQIQDGIKATLTREAFLISVNSARETEVVLNSLREQLLSLPGFGWQGPMQAAQYCLDNEINYEEALKWIDQSIGRNSNFSNNIIKVELLKRKGVTDEASKMEKTAFENASENELNTYGYQLINNNKIQEALDVFKLNIERHPDSWNAYDSYAEALNIFGDTDQAIKNYELAKSKAPDEQKERIKQILSSLQNP